MEFSLRVDFSPTKLPERRGSRRDSCTLWPDKLLKLWDVSQLKIDVFLAVILISSITSRCSGKWARTHPPKARLNACDFLCLFKPIMLPPADFCLAKIVAEIITSKQKFLPWSIAWGSDFDGAETLSEIPKEHNVLFDYLLWMIVVGEILHLQGSFQRALGPYNCVIQYAGNSVW